MTHTTGSDNPEATGGAPAPVATYTVLLAMPEYLREPSTADDEKHFAVKVRADTPEAAVTAAAGYLLWHFDTDYADRADAQAVANSVECIGIAEGEITFTADRPMTLTAD